MPIGDPGDWVFFFNSALILMIDSYTSHFQQDYNENYNVA